MSQSQLLYYKINTRHLDFEHSHWINTQTTLCYKYILQQTMLLWFPDLSDTIQLNFQTLMVLLNFYVRYTDMV